MTPLRRTYSNFDPFEFKSVYSIRSVTLVGKPLISILIAYPTSGTPVSAKSCNAYSFGVLYHGSFRSFSKSSKPD